MPQGTYLRPGEFLVIGEDAVSGCACINGAVIPWSEVEGIACVLETESGDWADVVIATGLSGAPALEFPPGSSFAPPYPVRTGMNELGRIQWIDSDTGDDWQAGTGASPCAANPGQGEWPPLEQVPANSRLGVIALIAGFSVLCQHFLRQRRRTTVALALFIASWPSVEPAHGDYQTKRVVIAVIDGLRFEDGFSPDSCRLHNIESLMEQGAFVPELLVTGVTVTSSAHMSIITGARHPVPNNRPVNENIMPIMPTLFEYYRQAQAAAGIPPADSLIKTVQIYGKRNECHLHDAGVHPGYGLAWGSRIRFPDEEAGDIGPHRDCRVYQTFLQEMAVNQPDLMLLNFAAVDQRGHYGQWEHYDFAIRRVDEAVASVWRQLQADPYYQGKTTMLVLSDHGRHDDAHTGFRHHGCDCYGCRHSYLLALGPDVLPGSVATEPWHLEDICATVAELMGFAAPLSEGRVIRAILREPQASPARRQDPASLSNTAGQSRHPSVTAEGNRVAVGWLDSDENGKTLFVRESADGGGTWTDRQPVTLPDARLAPEWIALGYASGTDLYAAICSYLPLPAGEPTQWNVWLKSITTNHSQYAGWAGQVGVRPSLVTADGAIQSAWMWIPPGAVVAPPYDGAVNIIVRHGANELFFRQTVADGELFPGESATIYGTAGRHVVWVSYLDWVWRLKHARFVSGTGWIISNLSATVPGSLVASPVLAAQGSSVVAACRRLPARPGAWHVEAWTSSDSGATWASGQPSVLNSPEANVSDVALASANGIFAAAWIQFSSGQWSIRGRTSADGGASWGEEQVWLSASGLPAELEIAAIQQDMALVWADQLPGRSEIYFLTVSGVFTVR